MLFKIWWIVCTRNVGKLVVIDLHENVIMYCETRFSGIPYITDCVIGELEKLGQKYKIALRIVRDPRFERIQCMHSGTYADDCLVERVTQVSKNSLKLSFGHSDVFHWCNEIIISFSTNVLSLPPVIKTWNEESERYPVYRLCIFHIEGKNITYICNNFITLCVNFYTCLVILQIYDWKNAWCLWCSEVIFMLTQFLIISLFIFTITIYYLPCKYQLMFVLE